MRLFFVFLFFTINVFAKPPLIILIGPPGSGKGTQADLIKSNFSYPHISTGDLLRDNIENQTQIGNQIEKLLKNGTMVPDSIILKMLYDRVHSNDCNNGAIIDGSSRTIDQAKYLYNVFSDEYNLIIFFFDLSDDKSTKRIINRVICKNCNAVYNKVYYPSKSDKKCDNCSENLLTRIDDKQDVIIKRLNFYNNQLPKLTKFYMQKSNVFHLDADQPRDEIFLVIKNLLLHIENNF
ncbi:MAG: adenylate kinase [Candidatus Anoxychlamydiales bacterium]|nr:adenylate kinase [Candidatus Anoxychlamydiales bacterium]